MLRPALFLLASLAVQLPAQAVHRPAPPPPQTAAEGTPSDTGGPALVNGFVLDSMTNLPLAGATVVISGTTQTATTDNGGRFHFELDSLQDGIYTIGFFHPSLDSLGITPPTQQIMIRRGTSQFVQLGVPSMTTIVAAICPDSSRTEGRGLVLGVVRDANTEQPLSGVHVVLMWTGMTVAANSVLKVPKAVSAVTGQDGSYRACGVASGTRVTAQARSATQRSGWIEVAVPPGGLTVRDFLLGTVRPPETVAQQSGGAQPSDSGGKGADTASAARGAPGATVAQAPPAPLGTSVLVGTVRGTNGKLLEGATVLLLGTRLATRTDEKGAFRLSGLPAGTQSVEFREIGYAPRRYAVDLTPHRETRIVAELEERAAVLQAIEVTAKTGSSIPGFDQRKKFGMGTFLTREDIEKRGAISTTDLFRGIPGVQVNWDGSEYIVQMSRSAATGVSCPVQYYIDGSPFLASSSDDMDQIVQPQDIEAIEVYKSATETPMEFQNAGGGACGTIVIWTRRGGTRRTNDKDNR